MASPTIIGGSDTGALTGSGASRTSDSFSITIPSTGGNRLFVVVSQGPSWSSATLGGQAMTVNSAADPTCQWESFAYIANPPTGTQTLTVNFPSNSSSIAYRGVTLQDCGAIDQVARNGAAASGSISRQITTTENNEIVMAFTIVGGASNPSNTWTATDIMVDQTGDYGHLAWSWKEHATAGNITASYSNTAGQCPGICVFSFKYNQAAGGGPERDARKLLLLGVG